MVWITDSQNLPYLLLRNMLLSRRGGVILTNQCFLTHYQDYPEQDKGRHYAHETRNGDPVIPVDDDQGLRKRISQKFIDAIRGFPRGSGVQKIGTYGHGIRRILYTHFSELTIIPAYPPY